MKTYVDRLTIGIVFFIFLLVSGSLFSRALQGERPNFSLPSFSFVAHPLTPTPSPTPTPTPLARPRRLHIPALSLVTTIEEVGEDREGRMDVPKDTNNVAWYNAGPKPGERGSAVVAGHYDDPQGPSVFYRLGSLQPGVQISVEDERGNVTTFVVESVETYADANFPLSHVFARTDDERLNLITCSGVFNPQTKNYSDRLVVFARKV